MDYLRQLRTTSGSLKAARCARRRALVTRGGSPVRGGRKPIRGGLRSGVSRGGRGCGDVKQVNGCCCGGVDCTAVVYAGGGRGNADIRLATDKYRP